LTAAGSGAAAGLEKISLTLESKDTIGAGGGGSGVFFEESMSMSNIERSVPQKLHFLEPGWRGESHIGQSLSPLGLGN
jgi:hypothetical protein